MWQSCVPNLILKAQEKIGKSVKRQKMHIFQQKNNMYAYFLITILNITLDITIQKDKLLSFTKTKDKFVYKNPSFQNL